MQIKDLQLLRLVWYLEAASLVLLIKHQRN